MKKSLTLMTAVLLTASVWAQSPEKMSYQAVVRNTGNDLVTSEIVGMKISILQGSAEGTLVYAETQSPETNANGLVSIEIGTGTTSDDFSAIDWSSGPYFIKTETDPAGGSNFTIVGTSQLLSVPYALYSAIAGNVFSGNYNDLTNQPFLFDGTWGSLTGKPIFAAVATSGSYTDLINTPTLQSSQWTTSGSNIYYNTGNVGVGTSSPATYIHAHGSPVTSRGQLSLSAPSGEGVFLSLYDDDIFKAYLWYDVGDEDLRLQNFTAGDLNLNPYGGRVGIGTDDPEFRLSLDNDGGIMAKGEYSSGNTLATTGQGTRLIWYPRKAAFRAGFALSNRWDDANIGNYSTASGYNTLASGTYSLAIGDYNEATGMAATAFGGGTNATGNYSTSLGGTTTASGNYSVTMGRFTDAESFACLAIGRYNTTSGSITPDSWEDTDPVFLIGNGTSNMGRHNAVLVRKDGAIFFPDVYEDGLILLPTRDLYINSAGQIGYFTSSIRYKNNVRPMEDVSWLYQLRPVNFLYNADNSGTKQYGLIAEEVENVNPQFVSYDDKGEVETVSYSQLVTPMLKAIQEQQQLIEELKARIEALESK